MDLTVAVYALASRLPASERFALSEQIRRAAVSIPSNVAEGQSCGEDGRYIHHLRIALGSLGELATDVEVARRLQMSAEPELRSIEESIARGGQLLHGLLRSRLAKRRLKVGVQSALFASLVLGPWLTFSIF